jgi:hypothetical protein
VRFISALGQRATVELLYERRLIEAEMTRQSLQELELRVGNKCKISLRHARVYARQEAEEQTRVSERPYAPGSAGGYGTVCPHYADSLVSSRRGLRSRGDRWQAH